MLLTPTANCTPLSVRAATALALDPDSVAVPSAKLPVEKDTVPAGVPPLPLVTVAVRTVVPLKVTLAELAASCMVTLTGVATPRPCHAVTRL